MMMMINKLCELVALDSPWLYEQTLLYSLALLPSAQMCCIIADVPYQGKGGMDAYI
jgi:hypothetical protein